jgi:DNA-binding SARP family transcriptional activator
MRERLCEYRMLTLYACGRTADALAAYRAYRLNLSRELGIEPGRSLRDLLAAILADDRAGITARLGCLPDRANVTTPARSRRRRAGRRPPGRRLG